MIAPQFLRFALVGAVGFFVDAGVLQIAVRQIGSDPYVGRVLSFLAAASATWILNRRYTFAPTGDIGLHREWLQYVSLMVTGGAVNYLVYALCVMSSELVRKYLVLGVAMGSISGLVFNYASSKYMLFERGRGHFKREK